MTVAVLDACVLYSAALRDFWMHLAVQSAFQPKWTSRIQEEWIRSLLANRPDLTREQLARTQLQMERWGRDWEAPPHEYLLPRLRLPDANDCHVLAAAIASRAEVIVTFNLGDFPTQTLARHDVQAVHPDAFAHRLLGEVPAAVLAGARNHRLSLVKRPKSRDAYLDTLALAGLPLTAAQLRDWEI